MRLLILTQGKQALVDDEDYEWLTRFKWSACRYGKSWYARARVPLGRGDVMYMHRLIMCPVRGLEIDHIDHDGLNNQKGNLRVVTKAEQKQNRRGAEDRNICGVRGVSYRVKTGRYLVQVTYGGTNNYFGSYQTLDEARQVAESVRSQLMTHSYEGDYADTAAR